MQCSQSLRPASIATRRAVTPQLTDLNEAERHARAVPIAEKNSLSEIIFTRGTTSGWTIFNSFVEKLVETAVEQCLSRAVCDG